ncbi:MAG: MBL fold metallo-hydrolase [Candidatus Dormibacteria bacterium]
MATPGLTSQVADEVFALSTDYPEVANCPLWVYLVRGRRAVLVDSGVATTYEATLAPALREVGVGPRDVELLLITHGHPDHLGGAYAVKAGTGAEVGAPLDEVGWVESFDRQWHEYWADLGGGYPIEAERVGMAALSGPGVAVERPLRDGDSLVVGGRELTVLQTRGHTRGHCAYLDRDSGAMFSGDAVQGDGVPSANGSSIFAPMYADVDDYIAGLTMLQAVEFEVLCPAHLQPLRRRAALDLLAHSIEFAEVTAPTCLDRVIRRAGKGGVRLRDLAAELGQAVGTVPPLSPQSVMTALAHLRKLARDEGCDVGLLAHDAAEELAGSGRDDA